MAETLCLLEEIPDRTGRGFTLKSGAPGDLHGPESNGLDILIAPEP